ncbi:MAG: DNA-3-methyladenine glycosylase [Flavobacteriales bacterium]
MIRKLDSSFYTRANVVRIARDLLGKVLVTELDGSRTTGIITETEAYAGVKDRASHAYTGKRTGRNAPMYARGGTAYVYLCYGVHHLFNVVTNLEDIPHAVLIRAIRPLEGTEIMARRRSPAAATTGGPGTLSQALGIRTVHSGLDLEGDVIWIEDHGLTIPKRRVIIGPRVGVDYAGDDALLPYRFRIAP